ncbi:gliding motility lipoprotein GldD [Hymenobacter sp. BRD67]|uniref:gliding motility lipoprotein GldD n=1 Tax=Hymenobacter sp. BRD67 TaxID=2675877 RepID=UPI00293BC146|nr:gliding motility lipoprotein GldD [Hymenobacter sp. BRD67]
MSVARFWNMALLATGVGGLLAACSSAPDYTPKPKGYNRIDLPPHRYRSLPAGHPYTFDYSQYAKVLRDSSYLAQPDWLNVYYPNLHANIQITYTNVVRNRQLYNKMMEDARKLTGKHQIKATSIEEKILRTPTGCAPRFLSWKGRCRASFSFIQPTAPSIFSGPPCISARPRPTIRWHP